MSDQVAANTALDDSFASPSEQLATVIDALIANPPKLARADKRGKFPMAAMKLNSAGNYDMLPLTVAMTEETFERIRDLVSAVIRCRPLLGDGDTSSSIAEPDAVPGKP